MTLRDPRSATWSGPRGRLVERIASAAALPVLLLLTGCTSAGAAPATAVTVTVSAAPASPAPGDGALLDIAAVCAAESMIATTLQNARADFASDSISAVQRDAALSSVVAQYRNLQIGARESEARQAIDAIVDHLAELELEPGEGFDVTDGAIAGPQERIALMCDEAGSPVTTFATSGG